MQTDKAELMTRFVSEWLHLSDQHPDCVLGDWLHTFSIMSGIALRLADVKDDAMEDAIERIGNMVRAAYQNSENNFQPSSLQ